MKLHEITKEQFVAAISDAKEDKFAKTFIAKCDLLKGWSHCMGLWDEEQLCGAIVVTISKRNPKTANLQLLHTFAAHRGKKVGSKLCDYVLGYAYGRGCEYFRVSSEKDAVDFYKKFGFVFVGKQKIGTQLCMFKLTSSKVKEIDFKIDDVIYSEMNRKGKGGCVEHFFDYKGIDFFTK